MTPTLTARDIQSVLAADGDPAQSIATLTWVLTIGAAVVFLLVVGLTAWAVLAPPTRRKWLASERTVIAGGIVLPVVTLSALLVYDLVTLDHSLGDDAWASSTGGAGMQAPLEVDVVGHQWWWRVTYRPDASAGAASAFETANEIRIPIGRVVDLHLTSADVIHSFWVPSLAHKLDMIPGRTNRLRLRARVPGTYRGQCAEYCGGAHAWMGLYVVAMTPADFETWRAGQATHGAEPTDAAVRNGRDVFQSTGCALCHAVRGTPAAGNVGPDLTHVASRLSLGAARLPNGIGAMAGWIASSEHLKPEIRMPSYRTLEGAQLSAVATYLESLR